MEVGGLGKCRKIHSECSKTSIFIYVEHIHVSIKMTPSGFYQDPLDEIRNGALKFSFCLDTIRWYFSSVRARAQHFFQIGMFRKMDKSLNRSVIEDL